MTEADSCSKNVIAYPEPPDADVAGTYLHAVPYGEEDRGGPATQADPDRRCHDCNVAVGGYHHPGCDWEQDPWNGDQLLSVVLGHDPEVGPRHGRLVTDPHHQISWEEVMEQNRERTGGDGDE